MSFLPHSHELLSAPESRLLLIDVQEKLLPVIHQQEEVLANCLKLARGAQILNVPVTATEQYPKGLGPTVASLAEYVSTRVEKLEFSGLRALQLGTASDSIDTRFKLVLAGVEAHICVLQTAFDLLSYGFRVHVVADAIGSRKPFDKQMAIERLISCGAVLTTTESVLFEWCETAGTPEFKAISQLVR